MFPKSKIGLLCAAMAWALLSAAASAQSFEDLETRLADHPSLTALTYAADAHRERSLAATALPDPVVSVGINNFPVFDPSFTAFLPTNKAVGISQAFPSTRNHN